MLDNRTAVGELQVGVFPSTEAMAAAAAANTAEILRRAVAARGQARAIVATGNSQLAFVSALADHDIPWSAVTIFHMDEYIGIPRDHPASFRRWISERIAEPFSPAAVEYIDGEAVDVEAECRRYETLLRQAPIDLTCMGIGENGHLAFNEPGQADFDDPNWVNVITLSPESVAQQVGEGHFPSPAEVPGTAISLSVPALLAAGDVQVVAPERRKAIAVRNTLVKDIDPAFPSTVLRRARGAVLFLDPESASESDGLLGARV